MDKPEIEYPCSWPFKVIGSDAEALQARLYQLLEGRECQLAVSQQSKQGTYTSFNLKVYVTSEAERDSLYVALRDLPNVKIVL
ncbi:YbeD family protein [Planctomycetota bacterium]